MQQLNLPSYDVRLREQQGRQLIFDFLRRRYVALTPEEWVRQHFTHYLALFKGYPTGLMVNEQELHCGEKKLRCDTIVYDRNMHPRAIVEYKAPHIPIEQKVFAQIAAYNMLLQVDYLIVSNGINHYCCRMDYANRCYHFLPDIPPYSEL